MTGKGCFEKVFEFLYFLTLPSAVGVCKKKLIIFRTFNEIFYSCVLRSLITYATNVFRNANESKTAELREIFFA